MGDGDTTLEGTSERSIVAGGVADALSGEGEMGRKALLPTPDTGVVSCSGEREREREEEGEEQEMKTEEGQRPAKTTKWTDKWDSKTRPSLANPL